MKSPQHIREEISNAGMSRIEAHEDKDLERYTYLQGWIAALTWVLTDETQ